jgi:hypothetical protein
MTTPNPPWWTADLQAIVSGKLILAAEARAGLMGRNGSAPRCRASWVARHCPRCGAGLDGRRRDARYCSHACRQAAWRARRREASR